MAHGDDKTKPARRITHSRTTPAAEREPIMVSGSLDGFPVFAERYVVLEELGRGGMGVVYAAQDQELGRKVALKLVHPEQGTASARARLLREAQALAQLKHPNVVTVYDVGSVGEQVFLAMELVEGPNLRDWLAGRPRDWREIVRVFAAAGRGLEAAHAAGLVHRDFKPSNVLAGDDGTVRVVDFGLARFAPGADPVTPFPSSAEHLAADITHAGGLVGTPGYMAPEVIRRRAADARSDQFSFGVSLLEALTGVLPYGDADRDQQLARIERGVTVDPRVAPARIRAVIARALQSDPAARFPSMADLVAALTDDPAARWRQRGVMVVAAGIALASAFALAGLPDRQGEPCGGRDAFLDGIWDDAARARLVAAFAGLGKPFAAAAARDVTGQLDRYAGELLAGRRASCLAARRPDTPPRLAELSAACLARRRSELGSLAGLLGNADLGIAQAAGRAAAGLSPVSDCTDVGALLALVPLPRDPAVRASVAEVRATLAHAKVLMDIGQSSPAIAILERAGDRARAAGYRPVIAEAALYTGFVREDSGDLPAAESAFRAALVAAQAGRDDGMVSRVASSLAIHVGRVRDRPAEGLGWGELALATAERLTDPRPHQVRAHYALALVEFGQGHLDDAERHARAALAINEELRGSMNIAAAEHLNLLGGIASARGRMAEAEAYYRRALEIRIRFSGPRNPSTIPFRTNLARMVSHADPRRAIPLERELLDLALENLGPDDPRTADVLFTLAGDLAAPPTLDEAEERARRALEILATRLGPTAIRTIDTKVLCARILRLRGKLAEARPLAEEAAAFLRTAQTSAEHGLIASTELASLDLQEGKLDAAAAEVEHALALDVPATNAHRATALLVQARIDARRGRRDRAAAAAAAAIRILAAAYGPDSYQTLEARRVLEETR